MAVDRAEKRATIYDGCVAERVGPRSRDRQKPGAKPIANPIEYEKPSVGRSNPSRFPIVRSGASAEWHARTTASTTGDRQVRRPDRTSIAGRGQRLLPPGGG